METIVALITIGANVNETDDSGMTPTYAKTWGERQRLGTLVRKRADVNHKDKVGDTALHEVCRGEISENERYIECARVLLEDKHWTLTRRTSWAQRAKLHEVVTREHGDD